MKIHVILLVVLMAVVSVAVAFMMNPNTPLPDENGSSSSGTIPVALYYGTKTAYLHTSMLEAADCNVTVINSNFLDTQSLDDFRIICFPGGNPWTFARDISLTGKEKIRNFVRDGGGYIGIGAGAELAAEKVVWTANDPNLTFLELFHGIAKSPNPGSDWPAMAQINIINSTHPITQGGPTTYQIYYRGGPFFIPNPDANVTFLANYEVGNRPAIMAFEYGAGRVFIIGARPDESQGPVWELMGRVVLWLTED